MELIIQEQEKTLAVILKGKLDSLEAPEAEAELLPKIEDNEFETLVIDCSELTYIASSGLRLFFMLVRTGKMNGARVVLKGVNDFVMSVLDSTGMAAMFEFE
jgi:anti-anti-sigma factor